MEQSEPSTTPSPELEIPKQPQVPVANKPVEPAQPAEAKAEPEPAPVEPAAKEKSPKQVWYKRFANWYKSHKKYSIPLTILVLAGIIMAVPATRYPVAAAFGAKHDITIQVLDSTTKSPVSGATVASGAVTAMTDGVGKATLHIKVGSRTIAISKKYYSDGSVTTIVPILSQKTIPVVDLNATGRQVKVTITNLITKKPLSNVDVKVLDIDAKTDSSGNAALVLPAGSSSQKAALSLDGYNSKTVQIMVSDSQVEQNNFDLTPSGQIYFLSNKSGTIDVVRTNLDGSSRTTILAGTGKEDDNNTVLLASRDWKYLALLSDRTGDGAKLYLIDTTDNNKVTIMDSSPATFTAIGWSDNKFVYDVNRSDFNSWQPNQTVVKSYDASTKQAIVLDKSGGSGSNSSNYAYESYDFYFYLVDSNLVFAKTWNFGSTASVTGKTDGIYSVNINGGTTQALKTFTYTDNAQYPYFNSVLNKPNEIYFDHLNGSSNSYYKYVSGALVPDSSIATDMNKEIRNGYNTYLQSPSGQKTFWSEYRDGKYTLFVGDSNAGNSTDIADLSDYQTYGWYTDDYLLVSKDSSELYIMPVTGATKDVPAVKISDFHKPSQNFYGYGGGYGGL